MRIPVEEQEVEIAIATPNSVEWADGVVVDVHRSADPREDLYRATVRLDDGRVLPNVHPDAIFPRQPKAAFR